jgi:hypothetical protein
MPLCKSVLALQAALAFISTSGGPRPDNKNFSTLATLSVFARRLTSRNETWTATPDEENSEQRKAKVAALTARRQAGWRDHRHNLDPQRKDEEKLYKLFPNLSFDKLHDDAKFVGVSHISGNWIPHLHGLKYCPLWFQNSHELAASLAGREPGNVVVDGDASTQGTLSREFHKTGGRTGRIVQGLYERGPVFPGEDLERVNLAGVCVGKVLENSGGLRGSGFFEVFLRIRFFGFRRGL